jgi:hypothetical protein
MSTLLETIGNRLFNKITLRPSKNALYSKLIEDIRRESRNTNIAADMSSAHFDHAKYFNSDEYIGVDIDIGRLRDGKAKYEADADYNAIQADIRQQIFQADSLGMIVSTHTLNNLNPENHSQVVDLFIEYLDSGGCLLIQLADDSPRREIERQLRESFEHVSRLDYNNTITRTFERWQQDIDGVYRPTMTGWRRYVNAVAILILSLIEQLPLPNTTYRYYMCTNKH